MAEFDELRAELAEAGATAHGEARALFRTRQRVARLKAMRRTAARRGGEPSELDGRIAEIEADIADRAGRLKGARAAEFDVFGRFAVLTDPRQRIGELSDRTPILLMPLRIETRFKRAAEFGGDIDELWVRVYPDDIMIDVFEDTPSVAEAQRARSYWADIWRAGGEEAGERGAWQGLLSGQGAGRAHWLIETYRPSNEAERPRKAEGIPTVILSIVTQAPLAEPERTTVREFWAAMWRAGEDLVAQTVATAALNAEVGDTRAAEIHRHYPPRNFADPPPPDTARADTTVVVVFVEFPRDEDIDLRVEGWSQVPETRLLPDRLVLLGYNGGALDLQRLGNPIPSTLAVSPDPSAEQEDQIKAENGELKVDAGFEWVTDFQKAIDVGMGFRIPLDGVAPSRFRHADGPRRAPALGRGRRGGRPYAAAEPPPRVEGRHLDPAAGPPHQQRRGRGRGL